MKKIINRNSESAINLDYFLTTEDNLFTPDDKPVSKKRGRPKKKKMPDGNEIEAEETSELNMTQSNVPYNIMYEETNNLLKGSIIQIDYLNTDIKTQIDQIKNSKTIKKKYDYMANLSATSGTLLNTKIQAIKEINKSITDSNNLELKRVKDLKLNEHKEDDDKTIMDMYNAFISTPVGNYQQPLGPTQADMTMVAGVNNIVRADIGDNDIPTQGPLTSTQNMMRLEHNSNIKTVVIFDQSTGARWFDVIDMTTQQSVPNIEKPDQMFLEDTTLDVRNGIARNTNLDTTYPLIVINGDVYSEY